MNYTKMVKKINYNNKKNKKVYYLLPKGKTKYSHDRSFLYNELFDAPPTHTWWRTISIEHNRPKVGYIQIAISKSWKFPYPFTAFALYEPH